ncbi:hypothetical protein Dimus_016059, partial [Dionaea muscipula]
NHMHTQQIRYEKRPQFCKSCWSIGHSELKFSQPQRGSSTASNVNQHVWRPKRQTRNTIWKRIPVKDKPPPVTAATAVVEFTAPDTITSSDLPCPGLQEPHEGTTTPPPGANPAEPRSSHPKTPQPCLAQPIIEQEGFKQVMSKRQKRNLRSQKNPEHHGDKPRDKDLS